MRTVDAPIELDLQVLVKNLIISRPSNFTLEFPIGNSKNLDIAICSISYIESDGILSKLHMINGSRELIKIASTLGDCENQLREYAFIRTHRSYLVNCSCIKFLESGVCSKITLKSNIILPVSRRKIKAIKTTFHALGIPCRRNPSV